MRSGELHWSSEMAVDPELTGAGCRQHPPRRRRARQRRASSARRARADLPVLAAPRRRRADATPFAVVAIGFEPGNAEAEQRAFSFVHALVKPGDRVPAARTAGARRDPESAQLAARAGQRPGDAAVDLRRRRRQARERRRSEGHRRQRDRAPEGRPVGADRSREGHRAGAARRPSRRSTPRCWPRRIGTCCRWRRCAARPSIVNRMVLQTGADASRLSRAGLPGRARRRPRDGRAGAVSRRIGARIHAASCPADRAAGAPRRGRSSRTATTRSPDC